MDQIPKRRPQRVHEVLWPDGEGPSVCPVCLRGNQPVPDGRRFVSEWKASQTGERGEGTLQRDPRDRQREDIRRRRLFLERRDGTRKGHPLSLGARGSSGDPGGRRLREDAPDSDQRHRQLKALADIIKSFFGWLASRGRRGEISHVAISPPYISCARRVVVCRQLP